MMTAEMKKKDEQVREEVLSELNQPLWAVISFNTCAARDLTYTEAEAKLRELETKNVSGLCIVSNAAADRMPA